MRHLFSWTAELDYARTWTFPADLFAQNYLSFEHRENKSLPKMNLFTLLHSVIATHI